MRDVYLKAKLRRKITELQDELQDCQELLALVEAGMPKPVPTPPSPPAVIDDPEAIAARVERVSRKFVYAQPITMPLHNQGEGSK